MNDLATISGVRGYIDKNGVAQLNLEDVARGLGFTEIAGSGNEVVRWARVKGYLNDLKFIATSGDGEYTGIFIPENIFYRLAMKAKNETAEAFQSKVADEILPAIRKTGTYSLPAMTPAQIVAAVANIVAEQEKQIQQLTVATEHVGQQVVSIKETIIVRDDEWRKWVNERLNVIAKARGGDFQQTRIDSYDLLESRGNYNLAVRVNNLRTRLQNAGGTKTQISAINKLDVIEGDVRLKEIYTIIVKEMAIKHMA